MKTKIILKNTLLITTLLTSGILPQVSYGQDDLLGEAEESLGMNPLDIEGRLSPSERLRKKRMRYEDKTMMMILKELERIRLKNERDLFVKTKNIIQGQFSGILRNPNEDSINVTQSSKVEPQPVTYDSSPVQNHPKLPELTEPTVVTTGITVQPENTNPPTIIVENTSKVILSLGSKTINPENLDCKSKVSLGLGFENYVSSNITLGIGFNYSSFEIKSKSNLVNQNGLSGYGLYPYNYTQNYNLFSPNQDRIIAYNRLSVDLNSKIFFTSVNKLKPYIGGALGYSKNSLSIDSLNTNYQTNNSNLADEGLNSGFFSGTGKIGIDFDISENAGLNFDMSYSKTISSSETKKSQLTVNTDQELLKSTAKSMEEAEVVAILAGISVRF